MLSNGFYQRNRENFAQQMEIDSFLVLFSGDAPEKTRDQQYNYHPNMNLYYLTGIETEGLIFVMTKTKDKIETLLFIDRVDEHKQRFDGTMLTLNTAKEKFAVDVVKYKDEMDNVMSRLIYSHPFKNLYMDMTRWKVDYMRKSDLYCQDMMVKYPYLQVVNAHPIIAAQRLVKSEEEIERHITSANITEKGVKAILNNLKPGLMEYQIEAYFTFELAYAGVHTPGFPTIAGSGKNTCCLHYSDKNCEIKDGDLILFDLGAQYEGYCTDVSRTFPANGTYSERQKEIYEAVLYVQETMIDTRFKPGTRRDELMEDTKNGLIEEFVKRGICKDREEAATHYYHGTCHSIGLDVHDVGDVGCTFAPGQIFAYEPGMYFPEENIGVRIEDTILITEDGCKVLSAGIPKKVADVEAFMKNQK